MESALYGPDGFYVRSADGPGGHFRTSVHASPLFADAVLRLIERIDATLGRPARFDIVDVGAGRGELLTELRSRLDERFRCIAVELAPSPDGLDCGIVWRRDVPDGIVGLLLATEWLDNVPLDVVELDENCNLRRVLVDPATGAETLGDGLDADETQWLARWWPGPIGDAAKVAEHGSVVEDHAARGDLPIGERAEIGWVRDRAWADVLSRIRRGAALAVDYGHLRDERPMFGTLTGFRGGRQLPAVPDGSRDVTAHVAMDALAAAGGRPYQLVHQRTALRALGISGGRPPLEQARTDPLGYVRALSTAAAAAELLEPAGLGGHWWLLHGIGIEVRGIIET
ncbi:MAG TPA: SAM-dependent methyltransferase [Actinoplanes sp.]